MRKRVFRLRHINKKLSFFKEVIVGRKLATNLGSLLPTEVGSGRKTVILT